MSNTAFALSPISARATSPTEADFEAIREAFVETARGRWFLEEYTKRNRNADTALVLDAVARIERTLAAQKELKAEEPQAEAVPDLTETLAAIKAIITAARSSAEAALSGPPMDEALAPTRKCARVIREIAWGLRESGADGRICSLLDSQVNAINAACDRVPTSAFRDQVLKAFDVAAAQIDQLGLSGEEVADIRQPDAAPVIDEARNTPTENVEGASGVSNDVSARVSNDNNAAVLDVALENPLREDASSLDAPTDIAADTHSASTHDMVPVETMESMTSTPSRPEIATQADAQQDTTPVSRATETGDFTGSVHADSERTVFETITLESPAAEDVIAEDSASEAKASVALDESLFDLAAEPVMQADNVASVAEHDQPPTGVMEPSATIEIPTEVVVEAVATEEETQQTTSALEPEIAVSRLEPSEPQFIASAVAIDEITVARQVVESLEAMADITIEEAASDDALADQNIVSDTMAVVAQNDLPLEDAPQIAEQPEEPVMISDISEAATAHAEQSVASDVVAVTPSEDAPSMAPDEAPVVSAKTPLPDNMLSEPLAQDSYVSASMDMSVAVETVAVSAANHMMDFAAGPTPDAITPPVSLGASLIASGIVAKPETARTDPLAAIRRMSHAERIAFFS